MKTFRTSPPAWYIPPTREEMREVAKGVELKSFAPDLVADLCNLAAGGDINPPSVYREVVWQAAVEAVGREPQKTIFWTRKDGPEKNRTEAVQARFDKLVRYHQNVQDFLREVDLAKFPGASPLAQAMSLLKLLSTQKGGSGGENGESLPIFQEGHPEGVAETLMDVMDTVESLSQEELDMLDPDGNLHDVEDSPEGDGQRSGHSALQALKVAEDLLSDNGRKMTILEVSRRLDQMSPLKARKQQKLEADPEGDEVQTRPMRDFSELSRVNKSAWGLRQENPTYFWYLAATKQLPVRERAKRIERRQCIFILCDGSGSMQGKKHWKASGVVMNRLKAVVSGDAEVWLGIFDTQLGKVSHAGTPEEARELMKQFSRQNFSGGGTDIASAIRSAHQQIDEMMKEGTLYRPEIIVLTDEDSSVSNLRKDEISGTTIHGFAMEVSNPALVELARSTNGVGVEKF
jgi:Mg-chelatase subunit ChlD